MSITRDKVICPFNKVEHEAISNWYVNVKLWAYNNPVHELKSRLTYTCLHTKYRSRAKTRFKAWPNWQANPPPHLCVCLRMCIRVCWECIWACKDCNTYGIQPWTTSTRWKGRRAGRWSFGQSLHTPQSSQHAKIDWITQKDHCVCGSCILPTIPMVVLHMVQHTIG